MSTLSVDPTRSAATADLPVSTWTRLAIIAAFLAWTGAIADPTMATVSPGVAVFGLAAGTIALMRQQRRGWGSVAAIAAVSNLAAVGVYGVTTTLFSA